MNDAEYAVMACGCHGTHKPTCREGWYRPVPDELRAPETDDEPKPRLRKLLSEPTVFVDIEGGAQAYSAAWLVATVAVLAGLTLAAIAWRWLR